MHRGYCGLLLAGSVISVTTLHAQPRDSSRDTTPLTVTIPFATRFGETVVAPRRYRVTLDANGLALVDPDSMLLVAVVPVEQSTAADSVAAPEVSIAVHGSELTITLRHLDQVYHAHGAQAELVTDRAPQVELAGKSETLVADAAPETTTERDLIDRALVRYLGDVKHCADKAHRARWQTDDPKFVRCLCPMTEKWRLPRLEHAIRVHRPLTRGRHGFSITVSPEGRATECRVWAGVEPPAEPSPTIAPDGDKGPTPP